MVHLGPAPSAVVVGAFYGYIAHIFLRYKPFVRGLLGCLGMVALGWVGIRIGKVPAPTSFYALGLPLGAGLYYLLLRVGFIEWFMTSPPEDAKNS